MKKTSLFKQYLLAKEILMIPVAHDPLCATIIQRAGFKVVGCGGYANSAALLGAPDIELLTLTEMVDAVWRFADAVDLPLFADGDNGHGNTTNVQRTVKQFEKAGAASVMLEDQVSPKRCGHMSSKHVVPADEFVAKIRAAVDARTDRPSPFWRAPTRSASRVYRKRSIAPTSAWRPARTGFCLRRPKLSIS